MIGEMIRKRRLDFGLRQTDIAKIIGMSRKDMFVLVTSPPANRWGAQIHARKNHSFLLIFEKTSRILK